MNSLDFTKKLISDFQEFTGNSDFPIIQNLWQGDVNEEKDAACRDYLQNIVIPHKKAVYENGIKLIETLGLKGVAKTLMCYRLIIHDYSKFSHTEVVGYAFWFDQSIKKSSPIHCGELFATAWHHHKNKNSHHPEHWLDVDKSGIVTALPMPYLDVVEMVADWIGAGISYGNPIENWLKDNLKRFLFHTDTCNVLKTILKHGLGIDVYLTGENTLDFQE